MSEQNAFPYTTNLNLLFPALSLVDVASVVSQVEAEWFNQTLCQVNDSVIRLGVMQGEYHWHKHDGDDEFFFVLEETAEKVGFDDFPPQNTVVGKIRLHYFVGEISDFGLFQQSLEGRFIIDLEDQSIELQPQQGYVVPKRRHPPHARTRTSYRNQEKEVLGARSVWSAVARYRFGLRLKRQSGKNFPHSKRFAPLREKHFLERYIILMVETAAIVPTGDA